METLKNVNKHLTEVFKQIATKDAALSTVADGLRNVASKCGEFKIDAWSKTDQRFVPIFLKAYLNELASTLEGAKS